MTDKETVETRNDPSQHPDNSAEHTEDAETHGDAADEQTTPADDAKEIAAKLLEAQARETRKKFNRIPQQTAFMFTKHAKLTYQNRMRR